MNTDIQAERLRERVLEPRRLREFTYYANDADDRYCMQCDALLTEVDWEHGACTQCSEPLVDDESVDEDLIDDGYGDY